MIRWQWPNEGVFKLNVDGSSFGNPGEAGFGGLVRGADGHWIFSFYGSVGFADNLLPELMAICNGLHIAWEHGYRCIYKNLLYNYQFFLQ